MAETPERHPFRHRYSVAQLPQGEHKGLNVDLPEARHMIAAFTFFNSAVTIWT
jgi:hypothetical protein